MAVTLTGCEDRIEAETRAFESAELHYQQGDYDAALEGYHSFVERYPQSPLATTARMRLRSIHHEVSSIMDRHSWPPPSYHGPQGQQSPAAPGSQDDAFPIDDWLGSPTPESAN